MTHPGIVPVYELGETPQGVPYYTMRFVKGERTLAAAIDEVRDKDIEERMKLLEPFATSQDVQQAETSKSDDERWARSKAANEKRAEELGMS